jgi:AraC family transcriptional regulator of adaptative response / DNA-3-methyladenine glycosylase II
VGEHAGWIAVQQEPRAAALSVRLSDGLLPALLPVRAALRRMLDLDAEPETLLAHFEHDAIMGPLVRRFPGIRLPGAPDGFELAVRGVLGQQISVAAARTLAGRLHEQLGEPIDGPPGITRLPITAARLAMASVDEVSAIGIPASRARTLVALAERVTSGAISFGPTGDIDAAKQALLDVPGIGAWTAEYIAMRGYHWPDAFPATDLGIRNALPGLDAATVAESWRPWRAYAAIHLWNSLAHAEK